MPLTSALRWPKQDRFTRIHESMLVLCDRNACAASLIVFFESWHNWKLEQREYTSLYNEMADDAGLSPVVDTSGWQYHTREQLQRGVMIYGGDTIDKALDFLEYKKDFISTNVPERLVMLHRTGRTRWFLLRVDKINDALDDYQTSQRRFKPPAHIAPARDTRNVVKPSDAALEVFMYWRMRLNHPRSIPDGKRLTLIGERLQEGRTVAELCLGIEGCANSAYHMGSNDGMGTGKPQIYDRIELIFKTASDVERFMGYADGHITLTDVQTRLENKQLIPTGAAQPIEATISSERLESIINTLYPLIITENGEMDTKSIRALSALIDGKADIFTVIGQQVVDRIEGTEGIYTQAHATRFNAIIQTVLNP